MARRPRARRSLRRRGQRRRRERTLETRGSRLHLTSSPVDWYAARAAGVAAYVLLTVVVSLGLGLAGRAQHERWPRFALEDVHRFGGILVGVFVSLHVVTVAIDSYLRFSLAAMLVPFLSSYRPFWIALGVVAAELLVALAITNRLRRRIPHRLWRRAHYASFAVWGAATLHGLGSGTDRSAAWLVAIELASVTVVAALLVLRVGCDRRIALPGGLAAGAVVAALAFGPLAFHPRTWNARSFRDSLAGQVSRDAGPSRELVSVAATGDGPQRVLLRADLLVEPQGLLSTSFQLEFLPSGMVCRGRVTHLVSYGFDGRCRAGDGSRRIVHARWRPAAGASFSGGTLEAHA